MFNARRARLIRVAYQMFPVRLLSLFILAIPSGKTHHSDILPMKISISIDISNKYLHGYYPVNYLAVYRTVMIGKRKPIWSFNLIPCGRGQHFINKVDCT